MESVQRQTLISSALGGVGDFNSETKFSEDRSRDSKLKSFNASQPSKMSAGSNSDESSKTSSSDSDSRSDSEESSVAKNKIEAVVEKHQSSDDSPDSTEGTCIIWA